MRYRLNVNDKVVYEQRSDGLIIATPTGSTAYALSAGGPIIHPSLDVWTILPMLPQSLSSRPFVISTDEKVEMDLFDGPNENAKICVDGQDDIDIPYGEKILISKMEKTLKLVHPNDNDFFEACREKLGWSLNISKNDDTKLQLVAIKMIENSKDTADSTSRSVEKKPTSNAKLTKPFIQVGIFGVENNAVKTGNQMSKLGLQTNTFEFNEFC